MLKTTNKIERFEKMANKKGVLEAFIEAEIRDKKGRLIEKRKFRSRSFVANLLRLLRQMMIRYTTGSSGIVKYNVITSAEPIDHTNTARGIEVNTYYASSVHNNLLAGAIAGETDFGIRVGRGTGTPTPANYNLDILIEHGTNTNQLQYGAVTIEAISIVGNTVTLTITRTFTNGSGSTVVVSEIGLSVRISVSATSAQFAYIQIARDLASPPINVPNGSTLTLRYLLKTTV